MKMHSPVSAEMIRFWKPCVLSVTSVLLCVFSESAVGGFNSHSVTAPGAL